MLFYAWSLAFVVAFIYNLFYIPFSIGLSYDLPLTILFIDILAVVITFIDSILRPFLAVNRQIEVQTNKKRLLKDYAKYYFAWDILSSIPFDYIFLLLGNTAACRYFRVLRLFKFYRLFEISSLVRQISSINVIVYRLTGLFFSFLIIGHWFNCILLYFGLWELYANRRFDGKTLLEYL